jgi:thiol-disulfide isomerase/thioredoxin
MKKLSLFVLVVMVAASVKAQPRVGQLAPDISLPNAKDSIVTLSSFRGKVVLLDFWASWCGPCRESIPSVIKLYNKYKAKGFEVVAVSIDSKRSQWVKAVKYFKMKYTSLLDPKGWEADVITSYGIEGIPATYLLDKEGKIVKIDAEGADLENAVISLLK